MLRRFALAAVLLSSSTAFASGAIEAANNQLRVSAAHQDFTYYELDEHKLTSNWWLDSEKGRQGGSAVTFSAQGQFAGIDNVYASLETASYSGETAYDGYLQGGTKLVPYKTTTKLETTDYQARLGVGATFGPANEFQLTPYGAIGSHEWLRDSSADPYGYAERYKHNFVGVGAMLQFAASPATVFKLDYLEGRTFNARMTLVADGTKFALGDKALRMVSVGVDHALTRNLHVHAEYRHTDFAYGESPVVNGYLEPSSETTRRQLFVGAGFTWR